MLGVNASFMFCLIRECVFFTHFKWWRSRLNMLNMLKRDTASAWIKIWFHRFWRNVSWCSAESTFKIGSKTSVCDAEPTLNQPWANVCWDWVSSTCNDQQPRRMIDLAGWLAAFWKASHQYSKLYKHNTCELSKRRRWSNVGLLLVQSRSWVSRVSGILPELIPIRV